MRLSLAAVSLATAVALLAGCSGSSQGTVPATGAPQVGGSSDFQTFPKVMTREQVSKLHPSVLPKWVQEEVSKRHRPSHIKVDKSAKPAIVITDLGGYIWWLTEKGVVTGYATDCSGAEGGVVDHQGRLIVSCTNSATIQIYNKGNTTGPANVVLNDTLGFYPTSAFEDKNGNIFATNIGGYTCGTSTCTNDPGDIVWWTTNNQSTGSSPSGTYTDPNLNMDYFADVDANGNVYLDGMYCTYQGVYGCYYEAAEVDTITNIMGSAPSATNDNVTLNFPGGIYTMANGKISVLDQGSYRAGNDALYLYSALPGTPAATLTPPQNVQKTCDPVSGGYNKADTRVLLGDGFCRAGELGTVSSNAWKSVTNIDMENPVGAAFLKSDK